MNLITYDCEVFAFDWIVVFKDLETGQYTVVHNDNEALTACISDDNIYCGFNSKHYDQFIIKAIALGNTPQEIKALSDYLIDGGQGWEYPSLLSIRFDFNNIDIRDDVQQGLSLKAIEGHLNMDIRESTVSFEIDRPLTEAELSETVFYCKHDVDAAEKLVEIRRDYLKTKLNLGKRAGIGEVKALSATNAKLTAMMLRAQRKEWNDGRDYVYPENLSLTDIPKPVLDFFETIHDKSTPDEELFKTSLEIEIGGMPCKYAWGGVHGSLTTYYEEATSDRVIQNRDVSSLYPSLIEQYNYLSRNVPDPEMFYVLRRDRLRAKHEGDKQTATDLKLPLNTVSGAQENPYNDLYDPLPTRSLRISGELFLTVLVMRLLNGSKTIKLLNINTDGIMYSVDRSERPIVDDICREWEEETRFELETDDIERVWIKDVNNLLIVKVGGAVKKVGGYLNYGVSVKGAWAINNSMVVVKKAIVEYLVNGTPVEDTVNADGDIFDYQLIAKAGSKYREAYQIVDGAKVPVQKVNRVYTTKDPRYGRLYKVKSENGNIAKIEMLPDHCIIDNDNKLTINDVDRQFYIDIAKKRISDFLGQEPDQKTGRQLKMELTTTETMPTVETKDDAITKKPTIYEILLTIREKFAETGIEKNGRNMQLSSKYFTLDDIVNTSRPIFHAHGMLPIESFTKDEGRLDIVDVTDPDNRLTFTIPMREYLGNAAVTPVQAMGATVTYYRRYLYSLALDLAEKDEIEEGFDLAPARKAPPATPAQRDKVKSELTNPSGNATALQIRQLKDALKKLREAHPEKEAYITELGLKTAGFTEISKEDCEKILVGVSKLCEKEGPKAVANDFDDDLPF